MAKSVPAEQVNVGVQGAQLSPPDYCQGAVRSGRSSFDLGACYGSPVRSGRATVASGGPSAASAPAARAANAADVVRKDTVTGASVGKQSGSVA